jgi:hypothetical protein
MQTIEILFLLCNNNCFLNFPGDTTPVPGPQVASPGTARTPGTMYSQVNTIQAIFDIEQSKGA